MAQALDSLRRFGLSQTRNALRVMWSDGPHARFEASSEESPVPPSFRVFTGRRNDQ